MGSLCALITYITILMGSLCALITYITILMGSLCALITYSNANRDKKLKQGFLRAVTNFKLIQVKC